MLSLNKTKATSEPLIKLEMSADEKDSDILDVSPSPIALAIEIAAPTPKSIDKADTRVNTGMTMLTADKASGPISRLTTMASVVVISRLETARKIEPRK